MSLKKRKIKEVKCLYPDCNVIVKIRSDAKAHSGKCRSHSHCKKPFESIYNNLLRDHRRLEITLTYEQFIEFTNIKNCYYCNTKINWIPYPTVDGKFKSMAYNLDRKENDKGYTKDNCVVSCFRCNNFKKGLNHNEFIVLCHLIGQKAFKSCGS